MARHYRNLTRLDLFLALAKEKNFPLHYTTLDCAMRCYGAVVVWLHFVMYLIFRYIYREVDSFPTADDDNSESEIGPLTPAKGSGSDTPVASATPKSGTKKSKKSSRKMGKSKKSKKAKKDALVESSPVDSPDVENTQSFEQKTPLLVLKEIEEERQELMKKFLAESTNGSALDKSLTVKDLPLWILLTDRVKGDEAENEKRLLMAEWLLRRGGMDSLPRGLPIVPQYREGVQHSKGEQIDRIALMEKFLDKLGAVESRSAETPGSAEKGSAERLGSGEKGFEDGYKEEKPTRRVLEAKHEGIGGVEDMEKPLVEPVNKSLSKEEIVPNMNRDVVTKAPGSSEYGDGSRETIVRKK
ncbi:hypothetical protein RB195_001320 [Necator americanus]|uniref:Uncharacterized protein n=1 Tax=Necator americanus TaxID=51031 RepID=A0ABR1DGQ5_NECAM